MKQSKGFTLVELMIVVAIVAILGTVAMGAFTENALSANRTDGRSALLTTATALEKCKAIYGTYNNANCGVSFPVTSKEGYYSVKNTSLTASAFTLTATPVSTGPQAKDTTCTSLTLTNLGLQGGTGTNASECW